MSEYIERREPFMEYSASGVKYLLWFMETRETVRLLKDHSPEEVRELVLEENLYQQKDRRRIINQYGCISRRIDAIPVKLRNLMLRADINTSKLVVLISAMASDRLLFELVYEVYRARIRLGEEEWPDSALNIFFNEKAEQNDLIAGWTEATVTKLKRTYTKFLLEAGLLRKEGGRAKRIVRPFIDQQLRQVLLEESMARYLYALTGEQ